MALTKDEVDEFIAIIRDDADVRERVRAVLLTQDLLELPQRVAELRAALEDHIARTEERFSAVDQRFDQVDQRLDREFGEVNRRLDKVEGDVGNLRGEAFETRYLRHAPSRFGRRYLKVRPVTLGNEGDFHTALADGRISEAEWDDAVLIDFLATGVPKDDPALGEVHLAVELSRLIDASDVERAHRRAEILRKVWPSTVAIVDGELITAGAKARAAELGVVAMIDRESETAA